MGKTKSFQSFWILMGLLFITSLFSPVQAEENETEQSEVYRTLIIQKDFNSLTEESEEIDKLREEEFTFTLYLENIIEHTWLEGVFDYEIYQINSVIDTDTSDITEQAPDQIFELEPGLASPQSTLIRQGHLVNIAGAVDQEELIEEDYPQDNDIQADDQGVYTFSLKADQYLVIHGLPEQGYVYLIEEVNIPEGMEYLEGSLLDFDPNLLTVINEENLDLVSLQFPMEGEVVEEDLPARWISITNTLIDDGTVEMVIPNVGGSGTEMIQFFGVILLAGGVLLVNRLQHRS